MSKNWVYGKFALKLSADIYLGLGANLGDPLVTFNQSLTHVEAFAELISISKIYRSAPFGFSDQPPFRNAAVKISTELSPLTLLKKLQETERKLGKKVIHKNGPRIIDIDILLYGDLSIETKGLVIPHPRILERDFVLHPLLDLNPAISHPVWNPKAAKSALRKLRQKYVDGEPEVWVRTN